MEREERVEFLRELYPGLSEDKLREMATRLGGRKGVELAA